MSDHPLTTLNRIDPEILDHLEGMDKRVYDDGALPRRIKLLIAMAFDAAHGAQGGVRALAQMAMKEGATTQEIAEVLRVAYYLSGVGTLYTASIALKDVLE